MKPWGVWGIAVVCIALGPSSGCKAPAETAPKPGDVTEARVTSEAAAGNNWLLNGRTFDEGHFSPLKQITDQNVSGLGVAWFLDIDTAMGVVSEPIVVDGVIYVSAPMSKVYAVDAVSGKLIWKFDPHIQLNMAINGSDFPRTNGLARQWVWKDILCTADCPRL